MRSAFQRNGKRHWAYARAWLYEEIHGQQG